MAETWITVTAAMVRASLAEGEYDVFAAGGLTPGAADPVAQAIATVVAKVQGAVGASGMNSVGPAGTVPPELQEEALILIMESLSTRVPHAGIVWDEIRKGRLKEAKETLAMVREGKFRTTEPEDTGTVGREADGGSYGGEDLIDFTNLR